MSQAPHFDSEDDLVAYLGDIDRNRDFADDTDEAYGRSYEARQRLQDAVTAMQDNPALITDRTVDALILIALHSPFADISEDPPYHRQNFQQDISLTAVRLLPGLAFAGPKTGERAVNALARIASESRDWDLRRESVGMMHVMGGWDVTAAAANTTLKKLAADNDNPIIRTLARDNLQSVATQWRADAVSVALEAQQQGTADPNDDARQRAYGMLGNMVKSIAELDEPTLRTLSETFSRAAAGDSCERVRKTAELCLQETEERLARPGQTPVHPFPRHQ